MTGLQRVILENGRLWPGACGDGKKAKQYKHTNSIGDA